MKNKKERCFYAGHNSDKRRVSIKRPDGKEYYIDFPKNEKDDNNILTWVKPMEIELTKRYYQKIKSDIRRNIKRALSVNIEGIYFLFDDKDGVIEIFDIQTYSSTIYESLVDSKLIDITVGIPELAKDKIKKQIEFDDRIVKEIKLVEYRDINIVIEIKDFNVYMRKTKLKKLKNGKI